ncbi:unnamed protein product [Linum tenue]|uniref:TIR domain-containing protein n=1 Tax=Linum tenue TaxID=586396 RepID=A0AAV0LDY8_9ROSI|nr:unnamed protein product [Linum tenue]
MAFSTSWSQYNYHVFLSLRGKDTGKGFGDHLYTALEQAGFHTFRDDDEIVRREELDIELQKAMQESKLFLVVFSKDFASSTWCLDQLVKIMDLRRRSFPHHIVVMPVFYVDPMLVSDQADSYAAAFASHEENSKEKAEIWRAALREVSDLGGMVLQDGCIRYQAEFVQDIVKEVRKKLNRPIVHTPSHLIGIESRIADIDLWLQDSSSVPIGIIYGIGGVGKTTIAKEVFNLSLDRFEASCFLPNIRETSKQPNGMGFLQKQLLNTVLYDKNVKVNNEADGSNKIKDAIGCRRVLIVLDDVGHLEQVNMIVATWDWLYKGSKIIITTRHKRLLKDDKICRKFRIEELGDDESLQLFSQHVFGKANPNDGFMEHSLRAVKYCCGIPLALREWGTFLSDIDISEWNNALDKLEAILHNGIFKVLRVSYDSLKDDLARRLFLHIACFFIGMESDYVTKILDGCELFAKAGIQDLVDRFLLTIGENNRLIMHPLLRDMAREIVRQESPDDPGRRSRLWSHDDSISVLRENTSADTDCTTSFSMSHEFEMKALQKMRNLQLLQLNYGKLKGNYKYLPRSLIWLSWHGSPLKCMPSCLHLEKLVVLDMQRSSLKHIWHGTKVLTLGDMNILIGVLKAYDFTIRPYNYYDCPVVCFKENINFDNHRLYRLNS